jgi:hypothetical protein
LKSSIFYSGLVLVFLGVLVLPGCGDQHSSKANVIKDKQLLLAEYEPKDVVLLGLSEIQPAIGEQPAKLKLFVEVLDGFGTPLRYPGIIRFELYTRQLRSPISLGKQLAIWPDIDIRESAANNQYFRDYLRAYEFELEAKVAIAPGSYMVLITYTLPDGKRLISEAHLTLTK